MMLISFGRRLAEIRKSKKVSQDKLAKAVGVHGAVIGRYERDEVKPSIEMAVKIANAVDISLDYLVGNTDLILEKDIINKIQEIQKLDTKNREHLFALMNAFLRDYKTQQAYAS